MATLVIVRHGESEWNAQGIWTGTTDVHLSPQGWHESRQLGRLVSDIDFDEAYISEQVRTRETLQGILQSYSHSKIRHSVAPALNERDYGDYTGKNKWDMRKLVGEKMFRSVRREWNCPIPHGETLKDVYSRSVPFYRDTVVPKLQEGKNVLIIAHGNSIRSLVKYIESVSDEDIADIEIQFGEALVYTTDHVGKMQTRESRMIPFGAVSGLKRKQPARN